jgi:hypothetical protein
MNASNKPPAVREFFYCDNDKGERIGGFWAATREEAFKQWTERYPEKPLTKLEDWKKFFLSD